MKKIKLTWHFYVITLIGIALVSAFFLIRHSISEKEFTLPYAYSYIEAPDGIPYNFIISQFEEKKDLVTYQNNPIKWEHDTLESYPSIAINRKNIERSLRESDENQNVENVKRHLVRLAIDENVKMGYVNKVKNELTRNGKKQLFFDVKVARQGQYPEIQTPVFPMKNFDWEEDSVKLAKTFLSLGKKSNVIEVKYLTHKKVKIGISYPEKKEFTTSLSKYCATMETLIMANPDYVVKFYIQDRNSFGSYMAIVSLTKKAIDTIREKQAQALWNKSFNELDHEIRQALSVKYPFNLFELSEEIQEFERN
ncbi:MAG: hypothetical protein LBV02_06160 [Bacteroidales bacterium]|jgi:hypothetical protein|nr:hypothetical protein [Bacteroidales bacterium]